MVRAKLNCCVRLLSVRASALSRPIAVGDGANDLPMLSIAGLGVAFRAKPLVRQSANQAISSVGLDGILYLLGVRDYDLPSTAQLINPH
jgi:phosphoserine phosphatase